MYKFFFTFLLVALAGFNLSFGHIAFSDHQELMTYSDSSCLLEPCIAGHQSDASETNCLSHCVQASVIDRVMLAVGQQQTFLIFFIILIVAAVIFTKTVLLLLRSDEAIGKFFLQRQLAGVIIRN